MRIKNFLAVLLATAATACGEVLSPSDAGNLVPRTVIEDPGLPAISLNGTRIHLETFGNAANPVIIFLHGGPGSDYRGLLPLGARHAGYSLADEYFLVYWDQRGTGLSERVEREYLTSDVYIDDLHELITRYSPTRPVYLIGESWGAMYATLYINRYPQRVAGAVLIESGPLNAETMKRIESDMFDMDLRKEWLNDYAWSSQFFTADDHARMDYERMLGAKHSQPRYHQRIDNPQPVWRLGAAANRYVSESGQNADGEWIYDFTDNLDAFTTPVLFIAGSLSEVQGPSLQQEQVQFYPQASLTTVNGAGHDVAWVKTPEVVTHIRNYLNARKGTN